MLRAFAGWPYLDWAPPGMPGKMGVMQYVRYSDGGQKLQLILLPSVEVGECLIAGKRRAQTTYAHPAQPVGESSYICGRSLASTIHLFFTDNALHHPSATGQTCVEHIASRVRPLPREGCCT